MALNWLTQRSRDRDGYPSLVFENKVWTFTELARSLHTPTNRITQILKGETGITADAALRLGRWFGTGAELWLNLQKAYELRLAEELAGEEIQKMIQPRLSINNQQLVQV